MPARGWVLKNQHADIESSRERAVAYPGCQLEHDPSAAIHTSPVREHDLPRAETGDGRRARHGKQVLLAAPDRPRHSERCAKVRIERCRGARELDCFARAEQFALRDRVGPVGTLRLGDALENTRLGEGDRSGAFSRFAGAVLIARRDGLIQSNATTRNVGTEGRAESVEEVGHREREEGEGDVPVEKPDRVGRIASSVG